jgi:hypothetical protein
VDLSKHVAVFLCLSSKMSTKQGPWFGGLNPAVRLGKRYCDEPELFPLLLSHVLVGRGSWVGGGRMIVVAVHHLGGDNFKSGWTPRSRRWGRRRRGSLVCRGLKRPGRSFTGQGGGAIRRGAQFGRTSDAEAEAEAEPLDGDGMLL